MTQAERVAWLALERAWLRAKSPAQRKAASRELFRMLDALDGDGGSNG